MVVTLLSCLYVCAGVVNVVGDVDIVVGGNGGSVVVGVGVTGGVGGGIVVGVAVGVGGIYVVLCCCCGGSWLWW